MKHDEMNVDLKLNSDGEVDMEYYMREARKMQSQVLVDLTVSAFRGLKAAGSYVYHKIFHIHQPTPQH